MPNYRTPRNPDPHRLHQPIPGLPENFRYPIGYFEPTNRQRDPEYLAKFEPFLHPCLIVNSNGETMLDSNSPRTAFGIRNKLSGKDDRLLKSAKRFLELGSGADAPMQASYEQEDRLEWAQTLGDAGHYGTALKIIEGLAETHQQTSAAARNRADAYYALGYSHGALIMWRN